MPAGKDSTVNKSVGTGAVGSKRFELPALEFKFGSLTDGTNIPPPLPSPIPEEAVPTPPDTPKDRPAAANGKTDAVKPQVSTVTTGVKRPAEEYPASPTLSSRQGSIRRLFSRNLLNKAYENGEEVSTANVRPPSRGAASVSDSRRAKRSSGWFSRLRGNDKHVSPLSPPLAEEKEPSGPPPPMIPELAEIKAKEDESFGSDLFKNIK
ncbi:hypothetical protein QBC43DRAFT_215119 [Cladorrhinum sp. PSN259]|nr:hypothetical protein QBC43DRAFT_215119 [Cladorrhinum sp. PSN259]